MIKKELLKLTPQERDVIFLWRVLPYPDKLTIKEIASQSTHDELFIKETITKFNHNCRIRLETKQFEQKLKDLLESFFCDY